MRHTTIHLFLSRFLVIKFFKLIFISSLFLFSNSAFGNTFFENIYTNFKKEVVSDINKHAIDTDYFINPTTPTVTAFAIQSSCTNGVVNSDGYLQLSAVTDGDKVNFSTGNTYTGPTDYNDASALTIGALPFQFNTGLSNPSGTQDYTIRVFNGETACFTDVVVTLNEQNCTVGCDCEEHIYLNETSNGGKIHKFSVASDGTLTEITNSGNAWYPGSGISEISTPHGIAIDLNGNVYVGEDSFADIRRLNCDGEIVPKSTFEIDHSGFNFGSIGNYLYTNPRANSGRSDYTINEYDLCTGELNRTLCLDVANDVSTDWGLYVDPRTQYIYATNAFSGTITNVADNEIFRFTQADFDNAGCVQPFLTADDDIVNVGDQELPHGNLRGITTDLDGNIYVVMQDRSGFVSGASRAGRLLKYDMNGNFVNSTAWHTDNTNIDGLYFALGIAYSEISNTLFISRGVSSLNCVQEYDLNLNDLGGAIAPSGTTGTAKGIGIIKECCPTNNNSTVDTLLCATSINDTLFLQELIACDGVICEGLWEDV